MEALVFYFCCLLGVAISSNDGTLRLVNSNANVLHSGFVQMLVDGEWLDVSSSAWTVTESDVVCRQLGYIEAVDVLDNNYYCTDAANKLRRVVADVSCTGLEVALAHCDSSVQYVEEGDDLSPCGVICAVPFSLRLNNTSTNLEVLIDFKWESFCSDLFDQSYADVACHQLGHKTGQYTEVARAEGTYAYVNGTCSGHEFNLIACANNPKDPMALTECNTSVSLQCFSPPSKPCHASHSQLSCDTASIKWIFPMPVVDIYYIRYRLSNAVNSSWTQFFKEPNTTNTTAVSVAITGLQPLLPYEVVLQGSNEYGNGTFSNPVEIMLDAPELLPPSLPQLISVDTESARISWEFQIPTCSLVCLVSFDVHFTTGNQVVTHTFDISHLTSSDSVGYMAHASGLKAMTTYSIKVRASARLATNKQCIGQSGTIINGIYSEALEITTPAEDNLGFFDLIVLNNPYISLSLFIVTFTLVLVLLMAILACCIIFRRCCRKKPKRIYQRRISNSDDNIYTAGDLSEQSYIPMVSSSAPNSLRITSRRVSNTPSISGPRSLWIDFPQPIASTTTFENSSLHDHSVNAIITSVTDEQDESRHDKNKDDSDDNSDNQYDEIGKTKECDSNISDENVYDEIHAKIGEEDAGSSEKDEEVENLPEAHRLSQIQSQESTDGTQTTVLPMIPPPREFSALPPVPKSGGIEHNERARKLKGGKGLSVSMCNIPLPPLPTTNLSSNTSKTIGRKTSEGQWSANLDSQEIRLVRRPRRDRRQTVDADTRERYRAQREQKGRRMSLEKTQALANKGSDSEAPYYSVPPADSLHVIASRQEDERSSSPEYEVLLHPKSMTRETKPDNITKTRPSRPPPPVPAVVVHSPTTQGHETLQ